MFMASLTAIMCFVAIIGSILCIMMWNDMDLDGKKILVILFALWTLFALSFSLMKVQDHKAARQAYWEQKAR